MANEAKTTIRTGQITVRFKDAAEQTEISREIAAAGMESGSAYLTELFRRRHTSLPIASLEDRRYIEARIKDGLKSEADVYAAVLREAALGTVEPERTIVALPTPAPTSDETRQLLANIPTRDDLSAALKTALESFAAPASTNAGTEIAEIIQLARSLPTREELATAVEGLVTTSPDLASLTVSLPNRADVERIIEQIRGLKVPDVASLKLAIANLAERLTPITETYERHLDVIASGVKDLTVRPAPMQDLTPILARLDNMEGANAALHASNAALRNAVEGLTDSKRPVLTIAGLALSGATLIILLTALIWQPASIDIKANPHFQATTSRIDQELKAVERKADNAIALANNTSDRQSKLAVLVNEALVQTQNKP